MRSAAQLPQYAFVNGFSSVGIVVMNKLLFLDFGFPHATLITSIHLFGTSLILLLCMLVGVFRFKRLPIAKVLPLCVGFGGFVAVTNLSLLHNSVCFYQLSKLLATPVLVLVTSAIGGDRPSWRAKVSCALISVGVLLANTTDVNRNFLGTIHAFSALLVTCQYRMWVGPMQKELDCDSFQLLLYQAPISALALLLISVLSDDLMNNFYFPCADTTLAIMISTLLAFFVNISTHMLIEKASAIGYNALGHAKVFAVLLAGAALFDSPSSSLHSIAVTVTLAGAVLFPLSGS